MTDLERLQADKTTQRIYSREIKHGDKTKTIYQAVVAEARDSYLVWYFGELENSKETSLVSYWRRKEDFLKLWSPI